MMNRRIPAQVIAVFIIAVLTLASCGLSIDESPRLIAVQDLPEVLRPGQIPTPTPQIALAAGPGREQVHMIQANRLVTVERSIAETPETLLEILLRGTAPEEAAAGIQTAIFRGTRVQGVQVNELFDLAIVDLAPGSLDPRNSEQRLAFAQIVYTLTSLPGIDMVQFVQSDSSDPDADPIDLPVQHDGGTTLPGERVTREHFALLEPGTNPTPAFDIPLATPTPLIDPDAPPLFELSIWMLNESDELTKVSRTIARNGEAFLLAVLEGPLIEERTEGIRSAIPPDALANSISVANYDVQEIDEFGFASLRSANIATVDLEPSSLPPDFEGDGRFLAAAQIVYTLTELTEIDQVVFSVSGVAIPMPVDRPSGEDRALSLPFDPNVPSGLKRSDYASALPATDQPTPTPAITPAPTPTVVPEAEPTPTPGPEAEPTPTPGG